MTPSLEFKTLPAFKIVGVERYTDNGIPSIQAAWQELQKRGSEIPHQSTPQVAIGFEDYSRDLDMNAGGFPKYYYNAAMQVDTIGDVPDGLAAREVPEAEYAVFTHRGPIADLHETFAYIYQTWMPTSGYKMHPEKQFDFERYAEPMTDMNNVTVEIHVPVVKR